MDIAPADMARETAQATSTPEPARPAPPVPSLPGFSPQFDQLARALVALNMDEAFGNPVKNRHITVYPPGERPYNHSFIDLPGLLAHVRKALAAHGLFLVHQIHNTTLTVILMHGESGQFCKAATTVSARSGIHSVISEITMMRRVMTAALLGVAGEEDDDGNTAAGRTWDDQREKEDGWGAIVQSEDQAATTSEAIQVATDDPARELRRLIQRATTIDDGAGLITAWNSPAWREGAAGLIPDLTRAIDLTLGEAASMAWHGYATAETEQDIDDLDRLVAGEWSDALGALKDLSEDAHRALAWHFMACSEEVRRAAALAFSHILHDAQGDPVDEPYSDPARWAREFLECWDATPEADRPALLEHNEDAMIALSRHPSAHSLILDLIQAEDNAGVKAPSGIDDLTQSNPYDLSFRVETIQGVQAEEPPVMRTVSLPTPPVTQTKPTDWFLEPPVKSTGGIDLLAYVTAVSASLAQCDDGNDIEAWIKANGPVYLGDGEEEARVGPTTQAKVLRAIAGRRRELGLVMEPAGG